MNRTALLLAVLLALVASRALAADTITLEDGTAYTGTVLSWSGGMFLIKTDGQEEAQWVTVSEIRQIEFGLKK